MGSVFGTCLRCLCASVPKAKHRAGKVHVSINRLEREVLRGLHLALLLIDYVLGQL